MLQEEFYEMFDPDIKHKRYVELYSKLKISANEVLYKLEKIENNMNNIKLLLPLLPPAYLGII